MKKIISAIATLTFISFAFAQSGPLQGSGKIVNKTFDYTNFSQITLQDLDGKAIIEVGKPFSISVAIDDNLEKLLAVSASDNNLSISLKGNSNNNMYLENTNIQVIVAIPNLTYIKQAGNNALQVDGIAGEIFKIKCTGNGSATLNGNVDNLDIVCTGNGNVNAAKLLAKKVAITKRGNGTVITNTDNSFYANGSGNGDIINNGKGQAASNSNMLGNGEIKYPATQNNAVQSNTTKNNQPNVRIKNIGNSTVKLSVKYPIKGSYGIDVKPRQTIEESFPVGTKIYRGNRFADFKNPIYTVTAAAAQEFILE